MLQLEQANIRCTAAGEQKQGHGDGELLLKERHHFRGLGQPTGTNRPPKTLTGLSPAGPMAVQRNWKCPGPTGRWVPSWVLQIDPVSRVAQNGSPAQHPNPKTPKQRHGQHGKEENLQALNLFRVHCSRQSIQVSASLLRGLHDLNRPQAAAGRRCCVA